MSDKIAVSVSNVSKDFLLPHDKVDSIKGVFTNPFRGRSTVEVQHALKDISFDVKKGEFFGIVGRNGSGKSTLLKIIAGIYQPTKGSTGVDGRLVPFIELGVGFNPELTGRENTFLNGALMGFSKEEIAKKYDAIVRFAEISKFMDQKLKNYSSGMQVRLAFSVATILAESDILLIDEVLAVGDADFQAKCFAYFKKLKKDKKTVVFVSHDMDAIREYCDRAVLIDDNRLIEKGDVDKVTMAYRELFSGSGDTQNSASNEDAQKSASIGDRHGDQLIKTKNINVAVTTKLISITQVVVANNDIEAPVIGIRLRDGTGRDITGTNTKIENIHTGFFTKGEQKTVTWELENVLAEGDYYIDPAILHSDGVTVADWWNDAINFEVRKTRRLPYIVDPGFKVKITQKKL